MLPNFMHDLSTALPNLSIPDAHFPVLLSTLTRRRFQVKPATLLIHIDNFLIPLVEEFMVPWQLRSLNEYGECFSLDVKLFFSVSNITRLFLSFLLLWHAILILQGCKLDLLYVCYS